MSEEEKKTEVPFHYCAKASRSERDLGCEHLYWTQEDGKWVRIEKDEYDHLDQEGTQQVSKGAIHPCLHPDELVMTEEGYQPISEIKKGDKVYTQVGKFYPVEHVSRHEYTSSHLYEISVQGTNFTTKASDNHPFLIWRPERTNSGKFSRKTNPDHEVLWLKADQVQKGDYTMTPILQEDSLEGHENLSEEFWFIFGLYLAEGVLHKAGHGDNCYPSFTLHEDETHLIEKIRSYFDQKCKVSTYPQESKAFQVIAFDAQTGSLFLKFGNKLSHEKRMHPIVWKLPEGKRRAIFEGYMEGDGGTVHSYLQSKSVSPNLASQMKLLAESLGYRANIFRYEGPNESGIGDRKFKSTRPVYQTRYYDKTMKAVLAGESSSQATLIEHEGTTFILRLVQKVEEIPYEGDVVNLSVEGSPTFQTAVGMSHNTVKPFEVMEWLVETISEEGDQILDPFCGSGTTGIAAMRTGRSCSLIDLDEDGVYRDIIEGRLHGQKEALLNELPPHQRPNIVFEGEISEEHPAKMPEEVSFSDLFS